MLQVHLLGPPKVAWDGTPLPLPRRQVRGLFYCLAVRSRFVSREWLNFLFWPDIPDVLARRHLSHLLSHLRNSVPERSLIQVTENQIGLDSKLFWSDTNTFNQLFAMGTIDALQQVVELYHGDFLYGFSLPGRNEFEKWATGEGFIFESRYLDALATLIDHTKSSGEYLTAISFAQRYLDVDNVAEAIHRSLIELYNLTGNRNAAIQQFERCAVVLERELNVSPMPETRAVYESVLDNKAIPNFASKTHPFTIKLPALEVPLVGRANMLASLKDLWARAKNGYPQFVFVSGEAGIGKSRLISVFADQHSDEAVILNSSCHPVIRSIPYQPLVKALNSVVGRIVTGSRSQKDNLDNPLVSSTLSKTWLAEVARLVPDLHMISPGLPDPLPVSAAEAQGRLFEALSRFVLDLGSNPLPLLLILDDIHWADKATLDWVSYFGHYLHLCGFDGTNAPRLMILVTYRKEEEHVLSGFRRSLIKTIGITEMELTGLDPLAVQALVENLISPASNLNHIDQFTLTAWLMRTTGSNPFYIIEIVRSLLDQRLLKDDIGDPIRIPMPNTLRLALDERLQNLNSPARQVMEAGAVINGLFNFSLLHLTAGRDEMEMIEGLEELIAQQFFVEYEGKFKFRHDLIHQFIIEGLTPVRCQLLHPRAGMAFEKLFPDEVTALAYHFEQGNESIKAIHYYSLSAQRAEKIFAWHEAEQHQEHVLSLLNEIDPECRNKEYNHKRSQILASRAHLHYLQGRVADRNKDLETLKALAQTESLGLSLSVIREKVLYLNLDSHYEEAIVEAHKGLLISEKLDDHATSVRLLEQIGFAHYLLGQPRPALEALESALTLINKNMDTVMRGHICHVLGYVHLHLANYRRSLSYQQEAYALHQDAGDHNRVAWDGFDIVLLLLKMGQFSASKVYLDDHLALSKRIYARPPEAYGLTLIGNWHLYQGDYFNAAEYFKQAINLQHELGSGQGFVAAESGLGVCLYHLGDLESARLCLESAANRARSIANRRRLVDVLVMLGLLEISTGHLAKTFLLLQEAIDIALTSECHEGLALGLAALARSKRLAGEQGEALIHAEEAVRVATENDLPMSWLWGRLEIGLVHFAQGDSFTAMQITEQALALLPQANHAWIGTEQVHFVYARVLQEIGRFVDADEQLRNSGDVIASKAKLIPHPEGRQRYLTFTRERLSSVICPESPF